MSGAYPDDWREIAEKVKADAGGKCVRCGAAHDPASGYTLTVHHFDMNKSNCERWNLIALCQRCHLSVQARVRPAQAIFTEPAAWALPYISGFYEATGDRSNPSYDLGRWVSRYQRDGRLWPEWAPRPEEG